MVARLALAAIAAVAISVGASILMTKTSNLSALWNIVIGGTLALAGALLLYLIVVIVERIAFGF